MNVKALKKLVEVLQDVKPSIFDMNSWFRNSATSVCGTTACAAGYAAQHPWFKARGLRLDLQIYDNRLNKGIVCFGTKSEDEALEAFFKLTQAQVRYLFYPSGYATAMPSVRVVIKRLQKFIESGGEIDVKKVPGSFLATHGLQAA